MWTSYAPGTLLLSEANQWPEDVRPYLGDGDEFHMNFHFPLMPRIYHGPGPRRPDAHPRDPGPHAAHPRICQWATFLRNHDELTLEMVTEEERQFMWDFYAPEPRMRLNLGIRRRLAPLLDNDRARIELANSLLFTLPGSPVIYYGDEIGMGDNIWLDDRDGVRTPMQWTGEPNAGFSAAQPQDLYTPGDRRRGLRLPEGQRRKPSAPIQDSLLNRMREMIRIRESPPRLWPRRDPLSRIRESRDPGLSSKLPDDQQILVINNLSARAPVRIDLDVASLCGHTAHRSIH